MSDRSDVRFVSFDCYGTLIDLRFGELAGSLLADRVGGEQMPAFLADFANLRYDEVLGPWKPYEEVIGSALERTCRAAAVEFRPDDATALFESVPTRGPHPDVPGGLSQLAERFPLVILSNASDRQIGHNVTRLGAQFHAVLTSEMAGAYKPRRQAFEYMLDTLGCEPRHLVHVSSSWRYDLMTAHDIGVGRRVLVDRGHDRPSPGYEHDVVTGIDALADLLGCGP